MITDSDVLSKSLSARTGRRVDASSSGDHPGRMGAKGRPSRDKTETSIAPAEVGSEWVRPAYQKRSQEQRDRILAAGERVFAEVGFWQAHVLEIARRADCSVGSFYRRFQDKEALFLALQTEMAAKGKANIARFFDNDLCMTETLYDLFVHLVRNTARTMRSIEGYYRALFELSLRRHDVWTPMREVERYWAVQFLELLERRGQTQPDLDLDRAHLAIRLLNGQLLSRLFHGPGPFDVDDAPLHAELARMAITYMGLPCDSIPEGR